MTALPRLGIVGSGPVARAIAGAHRAAGGGVACVISRDEARAAGLAAACGASRSSTDVQDLAGAGVVLVCVSDRALADVGARLAGARLGAIPVLHTSGAFDGAELLVRAPGAALVVGSLHPLQSFPAGLAGAEGVRALAARVPGVHWFHEGAGADDARGLVAAWGGAFHGLSPGGKALYHAAAAIVSNHTVALFADATRLFAAAGVPPEESRPALATLLEGTAANLRTVGVPAALTGPVARGDVATVRRHVAALSQAAPELLAAYRVLARRAIVVACEKGAVDAATAVALDEALG